MTDFQETKDIKQDNDISACPQSARLLAAFVLYCIVVLRPR